MSVSRRDFLKKSAFGTVLLATAGCAASLSAPGRYPAPPGTLKVFEPKQYATLQAVLDRLIPPTATHPGASGVGLAWRLDEEFFHWPTTDQRDLKQLLDVFEDFTWLSGFWGPFTAMAPDRQEAYMRHWMTSWLDLQREGFAALRSVAMVLYYAQDASWEATGYPGPFDPRFRRPQHDGLDHSAV
jgi:hypothetical protein